MCYFLLLPVVLFVRLLDVPLLTATSSLVLQFPTLIRNSVSVLSNILLLLFLRTNWVQLFSVKGPQILSSGNGLPRRVLGVSVPAVFFFC